MLRTKAGRTIAAGIAGLGLAAALVVPAALGHPSATTPKLVGNSKAGKVAFLSTCAACHTLKAAGAQGNIGPNLDKVPLTQALLIKAITNGGASIMTKAQIAKYTTQMQPYKYLGIKTIDNSLYIYESTQDVARPGESRRAAGQAIRFSALARERHKPPLPFSGSFSGDPPPALMPSRPPGNVSCPCQFRDMGGALRPARGAPVG